MAKEVPTSIKKFGVRYGRRTKLKYGQLEESQRSKHKCPYCGKMSARRVSAGIWKCEKCNSKFTGKAYTI